MTTWHVSLQNFFCSSFTWTLTDIWTLLGQCYLLQEFVCKIFFPANHREWILYPTDEYEILSPLSKSHHCVILDNVVIPLVSCCFPPCVVCSSMTTSPSYEKRTQSFLLYQLFNFCCETILRYQLPTKLFSILTGREVAICFLKSFCLFSFYDWFLTSHHIKSLLIFCLYLHMTLLDLCFCSVFMSFNNIRLFFAYFTDRACEFLKVHIFPSFIYFHFSALWWCWIRAVVMRSLQVWCPRLVLHGEWITIWLRAIVLPYCVISDKVTKVWELRII